jgi:hypothetical protein
MEKRLQYIFIMGRSVGPSLNGGAGEQEQYIFCVCAHVSKSCNTCWHLIHGIELVEQPLGLQFFGEVFSRFFFSFFSRFVAEVV